MDEKRVDAIRTSCQRVVEPLTAGRPDDYFWGKRTSAGRQLAPYYLVYFLLADLLQFPKLGQQEKVAWSFVVCFKGKNFVIEHRKMGLGLFAQDENDPDAVQVVALINKAVKQARAYYEIKAEEAIDSSKLNVLQKSHHLLCRFLYLVELYEKRRDEAEAQKEDITAHYEIKRQAEWIAISAVEAFFSWTEHYLIHLALLKGSIASGREVVELAATEWGEKFKKALDLQKPDEKAFYDDLLHIRQQVRNYVDHGAFGKKGEAFHFHSPAGAVPVYLHTEGRKNHISMQEDLSFDEESVIRRLKAFISFIEDGPYREATKYIHNGYLPTVLTRVSDGTYNSAIQSAGSMDSLIEWMTRDWDRSGDMDW
jgi:hypothetical protein